MAADPMIEKVQKSVDARYVATQKKKAGPEPDNIYDRKAAYRQAMRALEKHNAGVPFPAPAAAPPAPAQGSRQPENRRRYYRQRG